MFGTPPQGRADYAFIQHIIASMDEKTGRCAILLPHGVLNRIDERQMRSNLVESDLIDCVVSIGKNLFFNSPMEACIMICRSKKTEERKGNVLFIRATDLVEKKNTDSYLTTEHIRQIVSLYNAHSYMEGRSRVLSISEIRENDYSLSPKLYVPAKGTVSIEEDFDSLVEMWDMAAASASKEFNSLSTLLV